MLGPGKKKKKERKRREEEGRGGEGGNGEVGPLQVIMAIRGYAVAEMYYVLKLTSLRFAF